MKTFFLFLTVASSIAQGLTYDLVALRQIDAAVSGLTNELAAVQNNYWPGKFKFFSFETTEPLDTAGSVTEFIPVQQSLQQVAVGGTAVIKSYALPTSAELDNWQTDTNIFVLVLTNKNTAEVTTNFFNKANHGFTLTVTVKPRAATWRKTWNFGPLSRLASDWFRVVE